ncbi:unnamed protein product, partial [Brassica rapa subsp. trilocularis]
MAETQRESFSQEWFYIPVGGSLPNTEQKNLAVGLQQLKEPFPLQNSNANNGRSAAFKRQSGANHIIRGLRNASPAPIKATIETIPCSIKESNPVIPPSGVRNRNITEEHTPFKSTSSSDDLTELKKPKATENEPYQIFLCESISKKEIAVKKSANCLQFGVIQSFEFSVLLDAANIVLNKPNGMAVQGGTGVKASIDELYAATCLTFDKSESPQLVHRLDRDCSGLLVLGRTQTAATPFHCIFLEKTTGTTPSSFLWCLKESWYLLSGSNLNLLVRHFRCVTCVSYLSSKVGSITEAPDGLRFISCEKNTIVPCRYEMEDSPYDPEQMVCMNYGEYANQKVRSLEAEYPTFLYAMPMTKTKVLFEVCFFSLSITIVTTKVPLLITWNPLQETCLPSKDVIMPIDLLKTKLMLRGIQPRSFCPVLHFSPMIRKKNVSSLSTESVIVVISENLAYVHAYMHTFM